MPTMSNHDVLGPMTWGAGGNSRQRYFPQDALARSDARGGINSLLFEESSDACAASGASVSASEHAYAASSACHRNSLVSANGYYGFHQHHGVDADTNAGAVLGQDCPMDTSENNPPAPAAFGAFGGSPSAGAFGFGGAHCVTATATGSFPLGPAPQHVWNADPLRNCGATRKRGLEARGVGGWGDAGAGLADAEEAAGRCVKRTRPSPSDPADAMTEAPPQAMAQEAEGFGMHISAPSTSEQSHSPAQMYELPIHQLPGSTSQLADAMTPRPRCLMGHFI